MIFLDLINLIKYDGLKIKQLTKQGVDTDPAKKKTDDTQLELYKKNIKYEAAILEIKLDLK